MSEQQKQRIVELAREIESRREYLVRESYWSLRLRWQAGITTASTEAFRIAQEARQ